MGDFPRGGVKSFRNATAAEALVVGTQIDFEDPKLSVGLAADTTTNGLEADGAKSIIFPRTSDTREEWRGQGKQGVDN